jgi:small redox-active disulfide protein 2
MKISVLGTGCARCDRLYETTRRALDELGLDAELEKVSGIQEIMAFGVMVTPALAIDGEVKVAGKVPDLDTIKELLS